MLRITFHINSRVCNLFFYTVPNDETSCSISLTDFWVSSLDCASVHLPAHAVLTALDTSTNRLNDVLSLGTDCLMPKKKNKKIKLLDSYVNFINFTYRVTHNENLVIFCCAKGELSIGGTRGTSHNLYPKNLSCTYSFFYLHSG